MKILTALTTIVMGSMCAIAIHAYDFHPAIYAGVVTKDSLLPSGFKELSSNPKGLIGVYDLDGTRITFETRRGPRTAEIYHGDPRTPAFEIDVRFIDEYGVPFFVQVGGDRPIDKSWNFGGMPYSSRELDPEQYSERIATALEAINTLHNIKFRQRYEPERKALVELSSFMRSLSTRDIIEEPSNGDVPGSIFKSCNYRQRVEIHDKPCCFGFGRHSATITKNIDSNGYTTSTFSTCNHGECATSSDMPMYCQWTSAADRCPISSTIECTTA